MVTVRLAPAVERRLDALAKATGRTRSSLIREAIVAHLEDLEDLQAAEHELRAVRAGRSGLVPLDALMKQYGLED